VKKAPAEPIETEEVGEEVFEEEFEDISGEEYVEER